MSGIDVQFIPLDDYINSASPEGLCFANGIIYIAEEETYKVHLFSYPSFKYLGYVDLGSYYPHPAGIRVFRNYLYVVDYTKGRYGAYNLLTSSFDYESSNGWIPSASGLALAPIFTARTTFISWHWSYAEYYRFNRDATGLTTISLSNNTGLVGVQDILTTPKGNLILVYDFQDTAGFILWNPHDDEIEAVWKCTDIKPPEGADIISIHKRRVIVGKEGQLNQRQGVLIIDGFPLL